MPGRSYNAQAMTHGMNGQEKDKAIDANGDHYTALYWEYSGETGRRWNIDPKGNPSVSPYATFENNPIWNTDVLGDSIAPGRTKGMNFILVGTKAMRDQDVQEHDNKKLHSAYYVDYKKAKKMERKSGGTLKVIETDKAADAINQIKGSLSPDQYVANLTIDFHRSSGPFDDPQFNDGSMESAFKNLANGYIGKESNVYLGMCWAGGNSGTKVQMVNLTERASNWLDGATTYGHQAAASSFSFFLSNHFSGPVWEEYGKSPDNLARRGYHTISYFEPKLGIVRSVELKSKVYIQNSGQIHMKSNVNLSSLPTMTPYNSTTPLININPLSTQGITPPGN